MRMSFKNTGCDLNYFFWKVQSILQDLTHLYSEFPAIFSGHTVSCLDVLNSLTQRLLNINLMPDSRFTAYFV